MDPVGPPEFLNLPNDRRAVILAEIKQTTQFAYDHAVPVVISLPPKAKNRAGLRSASGFLLKVGSQIYLGTADHVWKSFLTRRANGEDVIFQAGRFAVDASRPGVYRDEFRDLAFIPITEDDARRSGHIVSSAPHGWPPPYPAIGSYVVFSGCPERLRDQDSDDHVGFGSFSSIMRVTSASEEHVVCQFDREMWVSDGPNPPPAPGDDLSGMSGGPVFSLERSLSIPLIGLIFEFSANLDLMYIRTFTSVRLPKV